MTLGSAEQSRETAARKISPTKQPGIFMRVGLDAAHFKERRRNSIDPAAPAPFSLR
jgi:hypothetical protein